MSSTSDSSNRSSFRALSFAHSTRCSSILRWLFTASANALCASFTAHSHLASFASACTTLSSLTTPSASMFERASRTRSISGIETRFPSIVAKTRPKRSSLPARKSKSSCLTTSSSKVASSISWRATERTPAALSSRLARIETRHSSG